ncbi:ribosomal protein [Hirsutella rhossiliensis]|uniref:Small ribosomal subunit protein uS7m n=1 Tax=Hirsutella rhossiliensis TaxID=111463 RepID=A0A9P8SH11_9HYPO|nr:ribosomal protein s7p/S5e domain-containing protein [Hirsutella rhossiliensis]KAH0961669.1 ribosomal protein s7p/S5e domain-containing protein [Hirsutella rhossiliensis]
MSAGWRVWGACRALALRPKPALRPRAETFWQTRGATRFYSDDVHGHPSNPAETPQAPSATEVNIDAESSSEKAMQESSISIDPENVVPESSSMPVEDTSQDSYISGLDDAALEQMLYGGRVARTETDGGLTPAQEKALYREGSIPPAEEAEALEATEQAAESSLELVAPSEGEVEDLGHKFGLPPKPYPPGFNLKQRYHPVLEQITRLLMRDGKLSVAQRNMAMVMNFLRTSPAPIYSPKFPLLPGTPPASHLPLNPILYITIAIDSVAPLLKVRNIVGAGGGGRALELPQPLAVRQRRHTAFKWILDTVDKKPSRGSGRKQFPHRIAEEIIAVVEGRSGAWEKRRQVHKLGTASRANVGSKKIGKAKKK